LRRSRTTHEEKKSCDKGNEEEGGYSAEREYRYKKAGEKGVRGPKAGRKAEKKRKEEKWSYEVNKRNGEELYSKVRGRGGEPRLRVAVGDQSGARPREDAETHLWTANEKNKSRSWVAEDRDGGKEVSLRAGNHGSGRNLARRHKRSGFEKAGGVLKRQKGK